MRKPVVVISVAAFVATLLAYGAAWADKACPSCGEANRDDANFCEFCGSEFPTLKLTCAKCGAKNPGDASYCEMCGAGLQVSPEFQICPECGAEVSREAEFCKKCGGLLMPDVWEVDLNSLQTGSAKGVGIIGSKFYSLREGHIILGNPGGGGDEMTCGVVIDLAGYNVFKVGGKFSITRSGGYGYHQDTIFIMLTDGYFGCGLLAAKRTEYIYAVKGDLFRGPFIFGLPKGAKGEIIKGGFDLEGPWDGVHNFVFDIKKDTITIDGVTCKLPIERFADKAGLKLFVGVYDSLIAEVWDVRVERLR
jgi:ribosomal protein L40E